MNTKMVKVTTLDMNYIIRSLNLDDTENLLNMVEDLSDVMSVLSTDRECKAELITTVAKTQRLLIDLLRLK